MENESICKNSTTNHRRVLWLCLIGFAKRLCEDGSIGIGGVVNLDNGQSFTYDLSNLKVSNGNYIHMWRTITIQGTGHTGNQQPEPSFKLSSMPLLQIKSWGRHTSFSNTGNYNGTSHKRSTISDISTQYGNSPNALFNKH